MTNSNSHDKPRVNPYRVADYVMGAAELFQLPPDQGMEIAFAGRSNAGKSSVLNTLCEQRALARTSKTPGRTQLINLFRIDDERRLVDLPGYGFAKVSLDIKHRWQETLSQYLQQRQCLQGLVVLMDIRHPLKDVDTQMITWAQQVGLATHVLLNKSDKLKHGAAKNTLLQVSKSVHLLNPEATVQLFSALKKTGMESLLTKLDCWFKWGDNDQAKRETAELPKV